MPAAPARRGRVSWHRPEWRRYGLAALAWAAGAGVIAFLIAQQNIDDVATALAAVGWWFPVLVLTYVIAILLDCMGWRAVIPGKSRPGLAALGVRRWVGMSANALLPVAQIGGEFVRARLLGKLGLPGPLAAASVVVDMTVGLAMQIVFALIGLVLLFSALDGEAGVARIAAGVGLFSVLIAAFVWLQRRGLIAGLAGLLERLVRGTAWHRLVHDAHDLDREVRHLYHRTGRVVICAGWRLLGWLWPATELWLLFWVLGLPISLAEAVMLEVVGQVVRSAGFGIPGGLGVQEGGVVLTATWLGLPAELALATMLIRRLRELTCGLAGLGAWFMLERRHLRKARGRAEAETSQP